MAKLMAWVRGGTRLAFHTAGSNSSHYGLYILLYGLHGLNYFATLDAGVPPTLPSALSALGYELHYLTSSNVVWQRMEDYWRLLVDEFPRHLVARHELATHYEHRKRDLAAAERLCVEAIQYLETRAGLEYEVAGTKPLASFQHRLDRIQRKLNGGQERKP